MYELKNIYKSFGKIEVLKNVSLTVNEKEIISIVGASGAGKTTLLQIMGTLEKPDSGEIVLENRLISQLKNKELARFRNLNIGFVFQFHHLLPEFTAHENVCIPGYIAGTPKKEVETRATQLLERLGLAERAKHKPAKLSGGEQQRVSVARALINDPKLILADEPTGNLDSENAHSLHALFQELRAETGKSFVVVTHNQELAKTADRVVTMKDGSIT